MRTLRILYHLARADFLERIRRYSFLLMVALVVWIGYLSASGQFRMRVPPDHIGIINSAWVGGTMTVTVSFLLGWVGFYIVKGSVSRDYTTGVGQIMATTPLSRPLYMLGKWLSNFAVLGITILILLLEGLVMNLVFGTGGINLWALVAPLLVISLPCMGLIAAFAVLFESVSWLRGGLGNIIYFFAFLFALVSSSALATVGTPGFKINPYSDFTGWQIIGDSVSHAAQAVYPDVTGGFAFSITSLAATKYFHWNGIQWNADILLSRLVFMLVAIGIVLLAALLFDRFNSSRLHLIKRPKKASNKLVDSVLDSSSLSAQVENVETHTSVQSEQHLTPLTDAHGRFHFEALLISELKLFLKGQRWWWYTIAIGLIVAQLFNNLEVTRIMLVISWFWPILILSGLGCRESRFDTRQIVFSAPRPLLNQLLAAWLSAFIVTALIGSGALIRFILAGELISVLGWITGALFIPSLALALGTVTGSSKAFEVLFVLWMYLLTQKVPVLDFAGLTPQSPWYIYAPLALLLLALATLARRRQLRSG